ncbi:Dyp-type peroxidase [Marinomonas algicola]|uniref:Dyp-type peroxidase n=1 Tax=Marinomonas algicola TaxID=2773454 RepID=UPI0017481051|nr:Dyp-type peroxidase [Marinomonas algicola]
MPSEHQTGITAEQSSDALFITLNAKANKQQQIALALKQCPDIIVKMQNTYKEANLHAAIGIGSEYWSKISHIKPLQLTGFSQIDTQQAPDTPVDLILHIRSDRRDISHLLAQAIYQLFSHITTLEEEVACFKYLDNRDLTGFVDGTENPTGDHRVEVALVGEEDPTFSGGSYLHLQKFIHKLDSWEKLSIDKQETIFGRSKVDNIEFTSAEKSPHAHTKRTSIKNQQGESLEILRQSMPFSTLKESGLMFASYCRTPDNFNAMLKSMLIGDDEGKTDHLMKYTQAVTGQSFFVPSLNWLKQL